MASSLTSDDCSSVAVADELFNAHKGLLVLKPQAPCTSTFSFTVPSGCYALVTRHSADLDYCDEHGNIHAIWPAGLHFPYAPWVKVDYLVTKQSVIFDLPVKACKTRDNVTISVDTVLTFRIIGDPDRDEDSNLVRKFVYEVTPRGLEQQLRDATEEGIRTLARAMDHTEVYGIRSGIQEEDSKSTLGEEDLSDFNLSISTVDDSNNKDDNLSRSSADIDYLQDEDNSSGTKRGKNAADLMTETLNNQFTAQGIEIQSVIIRSVTLPEDIHSQMEDKTLSISLKAQQQILHEDAMQNTRMEQEIEGLMQSFQEKREQESQSGQEEIGKQKVKLKDEVSQAKRSEAKIREETRIRIENFLAENEYDIQKVKDRAAAESSSIALRMQMLTVENTANTKLEVGDRLAKAELISEQNAAACDKLLSQAEGEIAIGMKEKKDSTIEMKKMQVYDKLATNQEVIFGNDSDDIVNLYSVADKILEENAEKEKKGKGTPMSTIAELEILESLNQF